MGCDLDCGAADRAETEALVTGYFNSIAVAVERSPMDRPWLVGFHIPSEANHCGRTLTSAVRLFNEAQGPYRSPVEASSGFSQLLAMEVPE